MQLPHQGGQGHVEDRVVYIDDQRGGTEHDQDAPPMVTSSRQWRAHAPMGAGLGSAISPPVWVPGRIVSTWEAFT